jgi:hypothetical protein
MPSIILNTFSGCGRTKIKHANHKTIEMGNENGLEGYGFENPVLAVAPQDNQEQTTRVRVMIGVVRVRVRVRVWVKDLS